MWKKLLNYLFPSSEPPLGVWIPYYDWCHRPEWREAGYIIVDFDHIRNYIKVGMPHG